MDLKRIKVTKKQLINYGGDAIAAMTASVALIGFLTSYMPADQAGSLAVISLFLTRGSTLLANLIDSISNETL